MNEKEISLARIDAERIVLEYLESLDEQQLEQDIFEAIVEALKKK